MEDNSREITEKQSHNKKNSEESGEVSKEIEEILEEIPQEARHEVKKMIGMSMQMGGVISPQMELMKKMTPEHVSEFLIGQREALNNEFKESRENKIFAGFVLVVIMIFIVIIVVLLKENPEIMEKVLYTLGGLITGLLGGYGFGKTKRNE